MTDSEQSMSSASERSEGSDGHPLDAVLQRRAEEQASGPGSQGRGPSPLAGSKRARESSGEQGAQPKQPRGEAAARQRSPSGSLESGEVAGEAAPPSEAAAEGPGEPGAAADFDDELVEAAGTSSGSSDVSSAGESGRSDGSSGDEASSGEDMGLADELDASDADEEAVPAAAGLASAAAKPAPVLVVPKGVILVDEGDMLAPNSEVRRLLRQPRYFDLDYEEAGPRCFKCGGKGHKARDCTNEGKERPCFLCAQLGHDSRTCPNSLCFKCNRPGHMARDCPYGYKSQPWQEAAAVVCLRCGREDCPCAGQKDFVRAEGGCEGDYLKSDLQRVRCTDCGHRGHLGCKAAPAQPAKLSCHNCGEGGHLAEECWKETPQMVQRERMGGSRSGPQPQQQQDSGYYSMDSRGYGGGYQSGRSYGSQQQYGGGRYGDQQYGGGGRQQAGVAPKYAGYTYAAEAAGGGGGYRSGGGGSRSGGRGGGGGGAHQRWEGDRRDEPYGYGYQSYGSNRSGGRR